MLPERREGDQTLTEQIYPGDAQNHQTANKEHQQDDQGSCPAVLLTLLPGHKGISLLGLLETAGCARKGLMAARA